MENKLTNRIAIVMVLMLFCGCGSSNREINMPYKCLFNDLPNWYKEIAVIGAIVLIIIILSLIIAFIVLKYQLKKFENEN